LDHQPTVALQTDALIVHTTSAMSAKIDMVPVWVRTLVDPSMTWSPERLHTRGCASRRSQAWLELMQARISGSRRPEVLHMGLCRPELLAEMEEWVAFSEGERS